MEKLQRCVPDKTAGPGGEEAELSTNIQGGKYTLELEQTRILVYLGEPLPYAVAQEIYLDMIPAEGSYINAGILDNPAGTGSDRDRTILSVSPSGKRNQGRVPDSTVPHPR